MTSMDKKQSFSQDFEIPHFSAAVSGYIVENKVSD